MSRINYVASARKRKDGKAPHECYDCDQPIIEGQSYAWAQPSRYSARINWHSTCKAPPPSRLEANEKRSTAMAAFENGYDAIDLLRNEDDRGTDFDPEAFVERIKDEVLNVVGEGVREAAELWRESATNIEDGFGHPTSMSEEFEGYADDVDGVADEVEGIEPEEYDAEQYNDVDEWIDATLDSVVDELGSIEGNLP
jgi:hypothetical protein